MIRFVVRRLVTAVPTLFLISVIIFSLVQLTPGDPAVTIAGPDASGEQVEAIRERLGLNEPVVEQYLGWARGAVTGDLGGSLLNGVDVVDSIMFRLPITLSLAGLALLISLLIAVPAGTIAAIRSGGWLDRSIILFTSAGIAIPSFAVGLILVYVFALRYGWFPATGYVPFEESPAEWLRRLLLPAIALGVAVAAELTRYLRASLRDVLQSDYVRTARAKGLTPWKVIGKHGLKHASIPVITVLGLQAGRLLGGVVVIEQVFGIPGVGSLAVAAAFARDYPMIQGVALLAGVIVLVVTMLVDLSYSYFDPRIRAT